MPAGTWVSRSRSLRPSAPGRMGSDDAMTSFRLLLLACVAFAVAGCSTTQTNDDYSSLPPATQPIPGKLPPSAAQAVDGRADLPRLPAPAAGPVRATCSTAFAPGYALPDVQHFAVEREVEGYRAKPDFLDRTFRRGERYLYYIVGELEKRGMPLELALLPVVESAFNPVAYSRSRASGLWQFIPSTGKHYGLQQNWWIDERRDVIRATNAALDYLQYLNRYFNGDWYLAIAAYNGGEGTVSRAVERNAGAGTPDRLLQPRPQGRDARLRPEAAGHQPHRGRPDRLRPAVRGDPEPAVLRRRESGPADRPRRGGGPCRHHARRHVRAEPGLQPDDDATGRTPQPAAARRACRAVPAGVADRRRRGARRGSRRRSAASAEDDASCPARRDAEHDRPPLRRRDERNPACEQPARLGDPAGPGAGHPEVRARGRRVAGRRAGRRRAPGDRGTAAERQPATVPAARQSRSRACTW